MLGGSLHFFCDFSCSFLGSIGKCRSVQNLLRFYVAVAVWFRDGVSHGGSQRHSLSDVFVSVKFMSGHMLHTDCPEALSVLLSLA